MSTYAALLRRVKNTGRGNTEIDRTPPVFYDKNRTDRKGDLAMEELNYKRIKASGYKG